MRTIACGGDFYPQQADLRGSVLRLTFQMPESEVKTVSEPWDYGNDSGTSGAKLHVRYLVGGCLGVTARRLPNAVKDSTKCLVLFG
jgi:hypothetical protein